MTPAAKGSSRDEQEIQNRIEEFVTAWNKHDPRAMSVVYAEDGDLINPFGRVAKSRADIEVMLREEHAAGLKDSRFSLKSEGMRFLTSDIAVTDHAFEVTGARDPSGKELNLSGHLTQVHKRHDNKWEVAASRPMIPVPLRK